MSMLNLRKQGVYHWTFIIEKTSLAIHFLSCIYLGFVIHLIWCFKFTENVQISKKRITHLVYCNLRYSFILTLLKRVFIHGLEQRINRPSVPISVPIDQTANRGQCL